MRAMTGNVAIPKESYENYRLIQMLKKRIEELEERVNELATAKKEYDLNLPEAAMSAE